MVCDLQTYMKRKGNNMNFKKMLAMIMALVMVFSLAACSNTGDEQQSENPSESQPVESEKPSEEQPSEPVATGEFVWNGQKEVWSILPTTTAEGLVWINDTMGAIMEAEGFTYVKKDAQGNPAAQVTFVEDAIANGNVGALMIAAMAVDMLKPVVEEAISKGIAVAYLGAEPTDYQISGCVYTAYEITGMYAVQAAEDWVQKRVAEGGNVPTNAEGKYEVACDTYTDIADGIYRSNAIVGTVDASEILTRVSTTSSYLEGYNKAFNNATDVLNANPDCHIFIAYEPQLALGMDDAIRQHCEMNDLDLADYCVIACYGEDTTFTDAYNAAVADHSASAIKGYSTYGDPAMPYGDELAAQVGASYEAMAAFSEQLNPGVPVVIPPVLTGEHLADILLAACGIEGYEYEPGYGNTFYDTITVCNVYGYAGTWFRTDANPAIEYKTGTYIG